MAGGQRFRPDLDFGGSGGGHTTFLTGIVRPCFGVRPSLGLGYENFRQLLLVKPDLRIRQPQ